MDERKLLRTADLEEHVGGQPHEDPDATERGRHGSRVPEPRAPIGTEQIPVLTPPTPPRDQAHFPLGMVVLLATVAGCLAWSQGPTAGLVSFGVVATAAIVVTVATSAKGV